jgi:Spy/CpxP family protein refolding chaperone
MRRFCTVSLALGLVVLLAGPALAQQRQRGPRGGGRGGIAGLVENESVQKELKIDADQAAKVKEAIQKVQDKHKDEFAKLQDLGQDERRTKSRELNKVVSDECLTALNDVLKPEQIKRLKQIELQQAGAEAFTRADVQKTLSLQDEQKEKIKTITDDAAKDMRELRQGGNAQGSRDKIAALRKETMEKVQAVLTDDQKKSWKDLTGDPFEVVFQRPRPNANP